MLTHFEIPGTIEAQDLLSVAKKYGYSIICNEKGIALWIPK